MQHCVEICFTSVHPQKATTWQRLSSCQFTPRPGVPKSWNIRPPYSLPWVSLRFTIACLRDAIRGAITTRIMRFQSAYFQSTLIVRPCHKTRSVGKGGPERTNCREASVLPCPRGYVLPGGRGGTHSAPKNSCSGRLCLPYASFYDTVVIEAPPPTEESKSCLCAVILRRRLGHPHN